MPPGFGYGDRFPQDKTIGPGPGAYDPKALAELGFKPDPKSGFVGSDRFLAQEMTGEAVPVDARPPSAKPEANGRQAKPQPSFGRSASSRKKTNPDGSEQPSANTVPADAYEQLQAQLMAEQRRAAKLHENNNLLMTKVDALEHELGGKSKQVQDVQAQLHQVETTAGSAAKELEATRRQLDKAQASAVHAQDRVMTLEAVCAAKEQAVEGLTHESRRAADQLAACEGQVDELQRQLKAQQASHEAACRELEACRSRLQQEQQLGAARLAEHEEQRATAAALASSLETQVRVLRDETANGKAALEAAGGQVQQLEAAKLVLEQQLQGAGALVAGLEQQLRVLGEESEQDQAALQEAGMRMQHLAEFKEGLEEQLRVAGSAHAEQQQRLHALEEENAQAKAALEAAGVRTRELDAYSEGLEQRLDASLTLVANLEQQVALLGEECRQDKAALEDAGLNTQQLVEARMALEEQLLAAGSRHAELEGLQQGSAALAADLQQRLEVLGEESKRDKAALEDAGLTIQQLQEARGKLEQQLEDSEEGCGVVSDKLRAALQQLSVAVEGLAAAQHQNRELQQQHDALQEGHSSLQQRHEELQQQHKQLLVQHGDAALQHKEQQQQQNALQLEHSQLRQRCEELQRQLKELQEQYGALEQQYNALLAKQEASSSECSELQHQLQAAQRHNAQLAEELATAQDTGSALANQAASLHAELQTMHDVAAGLEGELSAAAERATELQSTMDSLQTSHTQMQVALVDESQKTKQLAVELNSAKAFLSSASDETSSMREENYSLAHQVDKLQAQLEEQEVRRQELESMQQELSSAYSQLAAAEEEARALQRELKQLKLQQLQQSSNDSQLQQELRAALERAEAMGREAEASRQAANEAETMVMEMHRLVDDNALLAERLQKMEVDLRELLGFNSNSLGHNNPRQKIQYHLRLKQELEELRHECILLLRDKFHLEQCVRYLAVRARLPMLHSDGGRGSEKQLQDGGRGGDKLRAVEAVQPDSLAPTHIYSTPVAQKEAKERARARRCSEPGMAVPTKEDIEKAIKKAQRRTMEEVESWKTPPPKAARPPSRGSSNGDHPSEPASPLPGADNNGKPAAGVPLEDRIMARIAAVCTPPTPRARRPDSAANSGTSTPTVTPTATPTKGAKPPKGRK